MLKIAFLLIGPAGFRPYGHIVSLLGLLVMAVAGLVAWDALDGQARVSHQFFGLVFLGIGLFHSLVVLGAKDGRERAMRLMRMALPLFVAFVLLAPPSLGAEWLASWLLAVALVIDGTIRMGVSLIVHVPGWRRSAWVAAAQLAGAAGLLWPWPFPPSGNLILVLALSLALAGRSAVRLGRDLRRLPEGESILRTSELSFRDWHKHAPTLHGDEAPRAANAPPLILYNWTPAGDPKGTIFLPVIDRYFAVPDVEGGMSSGHVSLELGDDIYISYYPNVEIERSSTDFINTMSGEPSHNFEGSFVPSFAFEVDDWRPPNRRFLIHRFSERRLRAFWDSYRADLTYSLVNRNCAVAIGPALEAAMEGIWAGPRPWLRLARLMLDPGLWLAAVIRNRTDYMTWTPGFVVDYVVELNRVIDQCEAGQMLRTDWPDIPGLIGEDFPPAYAAREAYDKA